MSTRVLRIICFTLCIFMGMRVVPSSAQAASGAAYYTRGLAEARAGHYAAAANDFEQALLHGHTDTGTFYQLGLAYWKLKRLNDADWAIVTALGDPSIARIAPDALKDVTALQNAGAVDVGPPALLRDVQMTEAAPKPISPAEIASGESQAAIGALESGTYFVAPSFVRTVNATTMGALSLAAADLQNNSNTVAKFVFLSTTPAPYASLVSYTRDLFSHLALQRAVLVVMTPQQTAAYTDRLSSSTTQGIVAQQVKTFHTGGSADLAANVARAIAQQADASEAAQNTRALIIGVIIVVLVLAAVTLAVIWVARRQPVAPGRISGRARPQVPARRAR